MHLRFTGTIWYWRGPAPFHFVSVPEAEAAMIAEIAPVVTYGWGMIPASVTIGRTTATTSLWPKDGGYVVPVKKALQDAEGLAVDDEVEVALDIDA
ncbi:hypothetical protein QE418_001882 [Microbacterium testaceum]|uniref:DUF1905 domain-containing protein n=1 Tax=Microbacterium TaxID=33882 RepID=UPI00277DC89F|nr:MULTISPECIES: DUF1905 domain-containing protein [Microbacterium]MDQ1112434.1 hypothetical protein [Microbacterium testaceum]MDR6097029.1 hypothetical protein [Microbacterium sp. SORGH_AS_0454]